MQILQSASQASALAVLDGVYERIHPCRSTTPPEADEWHTSPHFRRVPRDPLGPFVGRLLPLLPRSFHPAVVLTCCLDPTDRQACDLRVLNSNSASHLGLSASRLRADEDELEQLVAAAAPLAGGCLRRAHAWHACAQQTAGEDAAHPDQLPPRVAARVAVSRGHPGAHACGDDPSLGCGTEWRPALPAGGLTRLQLAVDGTQKAPRWCTALAQLRTLRSLAVDMSHGPLTHSVGDFMAVLQRLLALTRLSLSDPHAASFRRRRMAHMQSMSVPRRLIGGLAMLTQLQSLHLDGCCDVTLALGSTRPRAIAQLSRLTRLTSLHYTGVCYAGSCYGQVAGASEHVRALACAIRSLPGLQNLHVGVRGCWVRGGERIRKRRMHAGHRRLRNGLLRSLFDGSGLPALKHLAVFVHNPGYSELVDDSRDFVRCFHERMREKNAGLLTRLTGLHLGHDMLYWSQGALAALLGDTPALQALQLEPCYPWPTSGLVTSRDRIAHERWISKHCRRIAELVAVVPGMAGLTRLDIHKCYASADAVLQVVAALAAREGSSVGDQGLRVLDIGYNEVREEHAAELAGLLRQFRSLERLGIEHISLKAAFGLRGLRVVLPALASLPRLQRLDARWNCWWDEEDEAWDLTAGLGHVADIRL